MSPKKSHEVARMRDFIASLLASSASLAAVRHVVDIGAGQGYLSRALRDNLGLHVLALDANAGQTAGAERRVAALEKHRHKHDKAKKKTREQMRPSAGGETVDEQDGMANAAEEEGATSSSAPSVHGSITHRTVPVTSSSGTQSESEPDGLRLVVDDWIAETPPCRQESSYEQLPHAPASAPVLFVALHACGSLTPAILHSFLSWCAPRSGGGKPEWSDPTTGLTSPNWAPAAFLVVGCCYNLLQPQDFPLSSLLRTHTAHHTTPLLPYAALHLAAQVPTHWLATPATRASAELAIRKVVYRALLQPLLREAQEAHGGHSWGESGAGSEEKVDPPSSSLPGVKFGGGMDLDSDALRGTGETPANRRLGRLPDAAYASWAAFLAQASQRTGFHFCPSRPSHNPDVPPHPEYGALAVLHVLRCLLGPLAESLLIMDRLQWLREQAAVRGSRLDVERVNLFDQATGSGRNVALLGVLRE